MGSLRQLLCHVFSSLLLLTSSSSGQVSQKAMYLCHVLCTATEEPPLPSETVLLLDQLSESPISVEQIRAWTRRDPRLSRVLQFVLSGWPSTVDSADRDLKPFVTRELELSVVDGVILWGNRVVVPTPGRVLLLQELNACHPGIARMKTLARMFVWWPHLDSDIEAFIKKLYNLSITAFCSTSSAYLPLDVAHYSLVQTSC